jgi:hypothetical protein
MPLWANQSICAQFAEFGDRVHEVQHGDALEVAGFGVHVYGVDHALIHQDIPLVINTGFLVDGELFHPGDSFTIPEDPVTTLLVPISAPWLNAGEMIDYFRAVAPARVARVGKKSGCSLIAVRSHMPRSWTVRAFPHDHEGFYPRKWGKSLRDHENPARGSGGGARASNHIRKARHAAESPYFGMLTGHP